MIVTQDNIILLSDDRDCMKVEVLEHIKPKVYVKRELFCIEAHDLIDFYPKLKYEGKATMHHYSESEDDKDECDRETIKAVLTDKVAGPNNGQLAQIQVGNKLFYMALNCFWSMLSSLVIWGFYPLMEEDFYSDEMAYLLTKKVTIITEDKL